MKQEEKKRLVVQFRLAFSVISVSRNEQKESRNWITNVDIEG